MFHYNLLKQLLSLILSLPKLIISHDIVTDEPILTLYVAPLLLKRGRSDVMFTPLPCENSWDVRLEETGTAGF